MAWPNIDPAILSILLDGTEELAVWAWHKLTGDATDDKAKKAIARMRRRAAEAAVKAVQDELEQQAAIANLEMQLIKLGSLAEHVMIEIDEAEKRAGLPHILEGADVQQMPPDWHPGDDVTPLPEPPVEMIPEPIKTVIILNGIKTTVMDARLTYEQIVELAGKTGTPTVVYSTPEGTSGELLPGQTLVVTTNTVISALHTDNA